MNYIRYNKTMWNIYCFLFLFCCCCCTCGSSLYQFSLENKTIRFYYVVHTVIIILRKFRNVSLRRCDDTLQTVSIIIYTIVILNMTFNKVYSKIRCTLTIQPRSRVGHTFATLRWTLRRSNSPVRGGWHRLSTRRISDSHQGVRKRGEPRSGPGCCGACLWGTWNRLLISLEKKTDITIWKLPLPVTNLGFDLVNQRGCGRY